MLHQFLLSIGASFWNNERPIASIVCTSTALMFGWGCAKFWAAVLWRKKMSKIFPCPEYGFLTGNLPNMNEYGGFTLAFFKAMHAKYGPVFGFFLPPFDYHISIDKPEALQEVHKKATERPDSTFKVVNYLFKENILFQHGEWQKQMRRSYQEIVNDPEVHNKLSATAWAAIQKEIVGWTQKDVDVYKSFESMIYDIMGTVLFGDTWLSSNVGKRIMKNHTFCAHNVMKWAFLPWTPFWNQDYRDYANAKQGFWDDVDMMLEKRRKELAAGVDTDRKDVYTLLLTAKKADGSLFYDRPTAVSTMLVFLNGSFDTTLNSTVWTLYQLAKHPEVLKKLQAEIDKQVPGLKNGNGKDLPTIDKLRNDLPYLDAVIRESMRYMPAAPINMRVNLDSDYKVEGIGTIPKGVTVILPYECSMQKTDVFGDKCEDFNPERFMGDGEKVKTAKEMWTPFGGHTRMCVGRNFALVEMRLFLVAICSKFDFSLKDPNMEVSALYEAGINVINPKPMFVFKNR